MSTEKIMEQAQVFASAWSVVGGPFDGGDAMEAASVLGDGKPFMRGCELRDDAVGVFKP